jgi:hypothetical protein
VPLGKGRITAKTGDRTPGKVNKDPLHPNHEKIESLVGKSDVGRDKRIHIQDAISYARALKSGGAILGHKARREEAVGKISRWTGRRSPRTRLRHCEVEAIIGFVYGDPAL